MQRVDSSSDKFDKEAWEKHLTPFLNLWKKLNQVPLLSHTVIALLIKSVLEPQCSQMIRYTCTLVMDYESDICT